VSIEFHLTPAGAWHAPDLTALAARARGVDPALRPAFVASGAGEAQLQRLFAPDALCVTSGQQPAVLLGPLYTLHKAIGLIATARRFTALLGRDVVPIFWIAGDDHDFAEANHVGVLTHDNDVETLVLRERPADAPLTPLYREALGPEIDALVARVKELTPATEFRDDIFDWVGRHFTAERDIATASAEALADLLGPHGLVVFRPTAEAAKRVMAPTLLRALERARELDRALADRATEIEKAGGSVPVGVGDGATLIMLEAKLGRDRLVATDQGFATRRSGETFTLADLERIAADEPQRLSPNVLLRPAVEAALFPTLAYLAGPGEQAYFPQTTPIYDTLGIAPQTVLPRWSAAVIEPKIRKVLDKYELQPEDLDRPEGQLEQELVKDAVPDEGQQALSALRAVIEQEFGRLDRVSGAIDPTLAKPIKSARNSSFAAVNDIEKRLVAHLKQTNDVLVQQIAKARSNLYPLGKPQERVLNPVPYLVRYGRAYVTDALAAAQGWLDSLEARAGRP